MDDIMTFKENHVKITDSQIIDLLQNRMKLIDHVRNEQNLHCNDDETKIKELLLKITSMRENLQLEKHTLESKNHDLSKEQDHVIELETERNKFLEENQSLELQRNKLRSCKRNLQDQELLDQGRRKFSLYKELTRIRWDYERLKENIAGFVTNKRNYIHHFSYSHESMKDLSNLLWKEIHQSTIDSEDKDTCNKENIVQNK